MQEIRQLLKRIFERIDEEQRRNAAQQALSPYCQRAKMHLSVDEYEEFEKTIPAAVSAYTAFGEYWITDQRAFPFCVWLQRIDNRLDKEKRCNSAKLQAEEYSCALNKEIQRLKSISSRKKQDIETYFKHQVNDSRYRGYTFAAFLHSGEKQRCTAIANDKLRELVPAEFAEFISCRYSPHYFLLPIAEFSVENIPVLDFEFDISAIVETEVWLNPGEKTFDGYVFVFSDELKKSEFLGYYYQLLTPKDLGHTFWKSIPLVLVKGLLSGEMEPPGTTIVETSENYMTYAIEGFEDELTIPEDFSRYLQDIASVEGMVSSGIISKKVADVVVKKLDQPLTRQEPMLLKSASAPSFNDEDFLSALTSMGIRKRDAQQLRLLIPDNLPLEESIKLALQKYHTIR
jgi:hypothetical protein